MVSESGEIINRLRAGGLNMETIGQAVGRNRSLIRQVGTGAKPGNNLRDSLAALEARLSGITEARDRNVIARRLGDVPPPPRRTTSAGAPARTRRRTTYGKGTWSTSNVKQQAARSGGRGLMPALQRAADDGADVAVTVTFTRAVRVEAYKQGRRSVAGAGGTLDMQLGDAGDVLDEAGEGLSLAIAQAALDRGMISGVSTAAEAVAAMRTIELRTY